MGSFIIVSYFIVAVIYLTALVWASKPLAGWGCFHWIALTVLSICWPLTLVGMASIYFKDSQK